MNIHKIFNSLRVSHFQNGIFRIWEEVSQPRGFTGHPTAGWRFYRRVLTVLAQVPEGLIAQK